MLTTCTTACTVAVSLFLKCSRNHQPGNCYWGSVNIMREYSKFEYYTKCFCKTTRKALNKYCQGELTIINFLVIFKDVSIMICLDINKQK